MGVVERYRGRSYKIATPTMAVTRASTREGTPDSIFLVQPASAPRELDPSQVQRRDETNTEGEPKESVVDVDATVMRADLTGRVQCSQQAAFHLNIFVKTVSIRDTETGGRLGFKPLIGLCGPAAAERYTTGRNGLRRRTSDERQKRDDGTHDSKTARAVIPLQRVPLYAARPTAANSFTMLDTKLLASPNSMSVFGR
jgi:hypothetical protein